jgi:diaminopimelate decarboxylase
VTHDLLSSIARQHGTPCFVYDLDAIRHRAASLRDAFGGRFRISYAVKSNPNPTLLARMRGVVDQLDISSGGELLRATRQGWPAEQVGFTGPGKRDAELRAAVGNGVGAVVLESPDEARRLDAFAAEAALRQPVLIRISPLRVPAGFGSRMAGRPSQFGIDEEDLDPAVSVVREFGHLDLQGFHVYAGTQCLDGDALVENYSLVADLFRRVCARHDIRPSQLVFGSGLGIPYQDQDRPLDLPAIGERTIPILDRVRQDPRCAGAQLVLETGRYLVGEAGIYLTRVISAKRSRGTEIRICDGGMNHHLGACGHLGSVIRRNYRMFRVGDVVSGREGTIMGEYDLFGPLCTSVDALGHRVRFPSLDIGDVIGIHCSGAYGPSASPMFFISHPAPREILVDAAPAGTVAANVTDRYVRTNA